MNQINKLFIHTTWACNMDCPRCYIPKDLREDHTSRLNADYLKQTLKHPSIDKSNQTVAIYMGGEPSIVGEKKLREYMNVVTKALPNARHTMVTNLFYLPNWLVALSLKECAGQIETTYANGAKQTLSGHKSKYQEKFIKNLTTVTQAGINCTVNLELNIETIQAGIQPIISIMKESGAKDWAFDYSVNFDAFNHNPIYDRFDYPVLTGSATLKDYWDFVNSLKQDPWLVNNLVRITPRSEGYNVLDNHYSFLTINPDNTVTTNALFSTMKQLQYADVDALKKSKAFENYQRAVINRIKPRCLGCHEFSDCRGFSAHIPIQDGSGICAGGLDTQHV